MFKFLRRFLKEEVDETSRLQEQFGHFRRLLTENNQALEIMADMEEKLSGEFLFDTGYLETQADRLVTSVSGMVGELDLLTEGRYAELTAICQGALRMTQPRANCAVQHAALPNPVSRINAAGISALPGGYCSPA